MPFLLLTGDRLLHPQAKISGWVFCLILHTFMDLSLSLCILSLPVCVCVRVCVRVFFFPLPSMEAILCASFSETFFFHLCPNIFHLLLSVSHSMCLSFFSLFYSTFSYAHSYLFAFMTQPTFFLFILFLDLSLSLFLGVMSILWRSEILNSFTLSGY